jgi:hypothetical protein
VVGHEINDFRAGQRSSALKVKSERHFGKQLGSSLGIQIGQRRTLADSPSRVPLLKDEGQKPTE